MKIKEYIKNLYIEYPNTILQTHVLWDDYNKMIWLHVDIRDRLGVYITRVSTVLGKDPKKFQKYTRIAYSSIREYNV